MLLRWAIGIVFVLGLGNAPATADTPAIARQQPPQASDLPKSLDGLEPFITETMAKWKVPGLAIGIVQDGKVIWTQGIGKRDVAKNLPVTPRTLFAIGSISKSFTATSLGMLVQEKKLRWDLPVQEPFPEFRLHDRAVTEAATIIDLLAHRTGLPRHDLVWYRSGLSRRELMNALPDIDLNRQLREQWQYNNLMYTAAGCVIERLSGQSWENFVRARILMPLHMTATDFSVEEMRKASDYALPYGSVKGSARLISLCNLDAVGPAGSINSNVDEMSRYLAMHIERGKFGETQLITASTADALRTPRMVVPETDAGALHASTFPELGQTTYGLAFFLTSYRGRSLVWHSGSIDGYSALMSFLPREKIGVIVLTNLSGNRPVPVCVTRWVFDRLLGLEPIDWAFRAQELDRKAEQASKERQKSASKDSPGFSPPSHSLRDYAGTYAHRAYGKISIDETFRGLSFSWRGNTVPLPHRRFDIFDTEVDEETSDDSAIPKIRVTFLYNGDGAIDRLSCPLEPRVPDVVFAKQAAKTTTRMTSRSLPDGASKPLDVVISGGRIVDGTGNPWFYGDVGISGDRIAQVASPGTLASVPAKLRLDTKDLVVAPGFIDIQGHSRDELLTGDSRVIGKVTQGVTTEILGEGVTNAPSREVKEFDGPHGFDAWLKAMHKRGSSINFGSFLGSATVRSYVKGMARGSPSAGELESMKKLVRDAMNDGAFGLASALIYPPDSFVSTTDLIALCREFSGNGGLYITHMRSEGDQLLEAINEAIRIGKEADVPVEIYHLKAAGKRNWDKMAKAIDTIAAARARGQDVGADMYAYVAGGTGLTACLPPSSSADGKLFDNLADPQTRAKIRAEVQRPTSDWENLGELAGPENVLVLGLRKPENRKFAGKRLSEITAAMGKDWIDTVMDLVLSEHHRIDTIYFLMSEENLKQQLRQPWIKIGTDAGGHDPEKMKELVHPRSYGNYPRILGKYVRDERVISLEEAVRKMTSAVADRLSIRDRGLLREGQFADLVVFDPATIIDRATFENPHQLSTGVRDVFVNGVAVVREGKHTGAKPGMIVRGPAYRP
jgi:dihydroorotase/N-acyl-D-amino-acid deacylase